MSRKNNSRDFPVFAVILIVAGACLYFIYGTNSVLGGFYGEVLMGFGAFIFIAAALD